jgi:hypothetical protein
MPERMIEGNRVTLWTGSFGDAGGVPLLGCHYQITKASNHPSNSLGNHLIRTTNLA